MTGPAPTLWTVEREAAARQHFADGLSASRAAAKLGISRGAVIGKWHRMGLKRGRKAPASHQTKRFYGAAGAPGEQTKEASWWTDGDRQTLQAMWAEGASVEDIAARLGRSKAAIKVYVGKHRDLCPKRKHLGQKPRGKRTPLTVKPAPTPHPGNIARKASSRKHDPGLTGKRVANPLGPPWAREKRSERKPPKAVPVPLAAPDSAPVPFKDLAPGQCRWPLDHEASATMACCGAPVVDRFKRAGDRHATHCAFHLAAGQKVA